MEEEITRAIARREEAPLEERKHFTQDELDLLKRTYAAGTTDDEFRLFVSQCYRTGLDPFHRQVFAVMRWDSKQKREVMTIQVSIDGLRLVAQRSHEYQGQDGPYWCGADGIWHDVWLKPEPPMAARVGVLRAGFLRPLYAVATYQEYCQRKQDGSPVQMWAHMPANMLAKCAESLGLRRAFPAETSNLYTEEEMGQAENTPRQVPHQVVGTSSQAKPPGTPVSAPRGAPAVSAAPGGSPEQTRSPDGQSMIHHADPLWLWFVRLPERARKYKLATPRLTPPSDRNPVPILTFTDKVMEFRQLIKEAMMEDGIEGVEADELLGWPPLADAEAQPITIEGEAREIFDGVIPEGEENG